MKKLLALLLALAMVFALVACTAGGSDLDYVKKNGKMIIGYTVYEPMNYTDENGNGQTGIGNFWWAGKYVAFKLDVEKEGDYMLSFRYTYEGEDAPISKVMSVAVSNIVQPLGGEPFKTAKSITLSSPYRIHLPKGDAHLKLVIESVPAPGFYGLILTPAESDASETVKEERKERKKKARTAPAR